MTPTQHTELQNRYNIVVSYLAKTPKQVVNLLIDHPDMFPFIDTKKLRGTSLNKLIVSQPKVIEHLTDREYKKLLGKAWGFIGKNYPEILEQKFDFNKFTANPREQIVFLSLCPQYIDRVNTVNFTTDQWLHLIRNQPKCFNYCPKQILMSVSNEKWKLHFGYCINEARYKFLRDHPMVKLAFL